MLKRGFSFAPGYRLEQFLGRGQFGQVWRSTAPGGTSAAVKFIDLSGGEGAKEHEGIKRVKQIRHANLMPITAIWLLDAQGKPIEESPDVILETVALKPHADPLATADSLPSMSSPHISQPGPLAATDFAASPQPEAAWLVVSMLLGGKSLQQRLRECVKNGLPGIPPKELLAYMDESAKGLDFLNIPQHDLGAGLVAIQHCDVKPANIVLIGSSAVVCDFGLARILSRNQVTATSASGTPAYMAPEAIAGRPSKSSDQYSLAVTYYHLRTSTLPIGEGTLWEVLDAHRTGKLDLSRVPEHEQAVLKRATSLDWEKRFDSNLDFVESLREALRLEGHTRPVMMPVSSSIAAPATVPSSAIDPSMTLVPGQDITTPIANASVGSTDPTVANLKAGDTKRDSAIHAANLVDTAGLLSSEKADTDVWWQQPKWLAAAATVVLLSVAILGFALRPGEENLTPSNTNNNGSDAIVSDTEKVPQPKIDFSQIIPTSMLLIGHTGAVRDLGFSGDGTQLVSIGNDPKTFVWQLGELAKLPVGGTGKPIEHLDGIKADKGIETISVDPSGKFIATATYDRSMILNSFAEWSQPLKQLPLIDGEPVALAWHPESSYLFAATMAPNQIVFTPRQATRADSLFRYDVAKQIKNIAIDPQGTWLLLLDEEGIVSKIAWSELESIMKTPASPMPVRVTSAGSAVAKMLATRGESASDSALIAGGENGDVTIWSLSKTSTPQRQQIHAKAISAMAVTPQGLAGPIATGDDGGKIGIWRVDHQRPIVTQHVHSASITSIDISDDGHWLVAASLDGDITLWDLSQDELQMTRLTSANAGPAYCVKMDRAGRWIAVGHEQDVIALWDLRHAKMIVGKPTSKPEAETIPVPQSKDPEKVI